MTSDASIGLDDPRDNQQSGIDDEARERKAREDGESVLNDDAGHDVTREDIEQGVDVDPAGRATDRNTSADQLQRAGKTNTIDDDSIRLGNT